MLLKALAVYGVGVGGLTAIYAGLALAWAGLAEGVLMFLGGLFAFRLSEELTRSPAGEQHR